MSIKKILRIFRVAAAALCAVATVFALCGCESETENYPSPTEEFFVNDFADVITDEDSLTICTEGANLSEKTAAQAVVVTIESLNGTPIETYALELGRKWGVGDADKDNGVVVLLSKQDREVYIAVGYGLEGALNDSKVGRIIDNYGMQYFSADNFSEGLKQIYSCVVNEIYIEYGIEPEEGYTPVTVLPQGDTEDDVSVSKVLISWAVLIAIVAVYFLIFGRRGGLFIFGGPRFFGGGFNNHGGFGSGGGGSFGGFSGGGGSFGGGGAGRKF